MRLRTFPFTPEIRSKTMIATWMLALQLTTAPVGPMPAGTVAAPAALSTNDSLDPLLAEVIRQVRALGVASARFGRYERGLQTPPGSFASASICSISATLAARAGYREAQEDLLLSIANCLNTTDPGDLVLCLEGLWDQYIEQLEEVREVFGARKNFCDLAGEDIYDPLIDPDDFLDPEDYARGGGNEYFPLEVGTTWVYEQETEDELEHIVVTVMDDTRTILGVECAVVRDTVSVFELDDGEKGEGEVVEDTFDYYAVDKQLNVWYFGEDTWELENGVIVSVDGRWIAGEDFAKPGIVMHADPIAGMSYRQEFALDEAEDLATMLALDETVMIPLAPGQFDHCRKTEEFTPIEPGISEFKYYAPGIGLIREEDPADPDNALVLVELTPGG